MTQLSRIRKESTRSGVKHIITVGALNAGIMTQYDRDSADLRSVNRHFGAMNFIVVQNNSDEILAIDLDYTSARRLVVNPKSEITEDSIMYQEFNVTNISATNVSAGEVYITVGYERPLAREG